MKLFIYLFLFLILTLNSFSQNQKIDSLIKELRNEAIHVDGNYFGPTLMLVGEPAVIISKMGKSATRQLVSILDDSVKGVVAHYILTLTWKLPIASEKMTYSEKDRMYFVYSNELNFFIRGRSVYANKYDLKTNKLTWTAFLLDKINK